MFVGIAAVDPVSGTTPFGPALVGLTAVIPDVGPVPVPLAPTTPLPGADAAFQATVPPTTLSGDVTVDVGVNAPPTPPVPVATEPVSPPQEVEDGCSDPAKVSTVTARGAEKLVLTNMFVRLLLEDEVQAPQQLEFADSERRQTSSVRLDLVLRPGSSVRSDSIVPVPVGGPIPGGPSGGLLGDDRGASASAPNVAGNHLVFATASTDLQVQLEQYVKASSALKTQPPQFPSAP